ncbi:unnamed protein product [Soboliphyme baturini]|uniref:C-CAP/cofactor C-like domain-containing protein n=1 Tax=Soboliphyme baturini TaxID=241478 RepID=A0A183IC86_9BILA|nr:unnamed protein product [Soboliphyme baturini]
MGWLLSKCLTSENSHIGKNTVIKEDSGKTYSWSDRSNMNPEDYIFANGNGTVMVKSPNTINGQQFLIQNCKGCYVFILDHAGAVSIDDCSECSIIIGACSGSVFVRDCHQCLVLASCQQFRTRDSVNLNIHLLCKTKPVVESSFQIGFGCLQLFYKELEGNSKVATRIELTCIRSRLNDYYFEYHKNN